MKKYFKQLNKFLDVVIWALIMLLYAAYMCIFLNISLLLSYLTKWIDWTKTLNKGGKKLV